MKRTAFFLTLGVAVIVMSGLAVAGQINPKDGNPESAPTPTRPPGLGTGYCSTPGLAIIDNTTVQDNLVVADSGSILDLNVSLLIAHTWVGDLDIVLSHSGGCGPITILNRPGAPPPNTALGCSSDNIDATLDDEGANGNAESQCNGGPPAIGPGDFIAGDPPSNTLLSGCDGDNINGTWTLAITDNAGGDTGTLNEWCLVADVMVPVELQGFSID
jgi:hypothetical protein